MEPQAHNPQQPSAGESGPLREETAAAIAEAIAPYERESLAEASPLRDQPKKPNRRPSVRPLPERGGHRSNRGLSNRHR